MIELPPRSVTARRGVLAASRNALLFQALADRLPLADRCVDLTITSPPYGLSISYADGGDVDPAAWPAFMLAWLREVRRVTKPSGRLALNVPLDTFKGGYRPVYKLALDAAEAAGWTLEHAIVWAEGNTTTGNRALGSVNSAARPRPVDASEIIAIFSNGPWGPSSDNPDDISGREWQTYGRGPWTFPGARRSKGGHPAPFPDELPRRLMKLLSRRGDVILDPFVGRGTTVAVAVAERRIGIGSDRSPTYLVMAARRVAEVPLRLANGTGCAICHEPLLGRRFDAMTCSAGCRQKGYRRRKGVAT